MSQSPDEDFEPLSTREQIEAFVTKAQQQSGQWVLLGRQLPTSRGRPYRRRGLQVIYRNQAAAGIADISIRWPTHPPIRTAGWVNPLRNTP